jgi:hypothetical protein
MNAATVGRRPTRRCIVSAYFWVLLMAIGVWLCMVGYACALTLYEHRGNRALSWLAFLAALGFAGVNVWAAARVHFRV